MPTDLPPDYKPTPPGSDTGTDAKDPRAGGASGHPAGDVVDGAPGGDVPQPGPGVGPAIPGSPGGDVVAPAGVPTGTF